MTTANIEKAKDTYIGRFKYCEQLVIEEYKKRSPFRKIYLYGDINTLYHELYSAVHRAHNLRTKKYVAYELGKAVVYLILLVNRSCRGKKFSEIDGVELTPTYKLPINSSAENLSLELDQHRKKLLDYCVAASVVDRGSVPPKGFDYADNQLCIFYHAEALFKLLLAKAVMMHMNLVDLMERFITEGFKPQDRFLASTVEEKEVPASKADTDPGLTKGEKDKLYRDLQKYEERKEAARVREEAAKPDPIDEAMICGRANNMLRCVDEVYFVDTALKELPAALQGSDHDKNLVAGQLYNSTLELFQKLKDAGLAIGSFDVLFSTLTACVHDVHIAVNDISPLKVLADTFNKICMKVNENQIVDVQEFLPLLNTVVFLLRITGTHLDTVRKESNAETSAEASVEESDQAEPLCLESGDLRVMSWAVSEGDTTREAPEGYMLTPTDLVAQVSMQWSSETHARRLISLLNKTSAPPFSQRALQIDLTAMLNAVCRPDDLDAVQALDLVATFLNRLTIYVYTVSGGAVSPEMFVKGVVADYYKPAKSSLSSVYDQLARDGLYKVMEILYKVREHELLEQAGNFLLRVLKRHLQEVMTVCDHLASVFQISTHSVMSALAFKVEDADGPYQSLSIPAVQKDLTCLKRCENIKYSKLPVDNYAKSLEFWWQQHSLGLFKSANLEYPWAIRAATLPNYKHMWHTLLCHLEDCGNKSNLQQASFTTILAAIGQLYVETFRIQNMLRHNSRGFMGFLPSVQNYYTHANRNWVMNSNRRITPINSQYLYYVHRCYQYSEEVRHIADKSTLPPGDIQFLDTTFAFMAHTLYVLAAYLGTNIPTILRFYCTTVLADVMSVVACERQPDCTKETFDEAKKEYLNKVVRRSCEEVYPSGSYHTFLSLIHTLAYDQPAKG